MLIAAPKALREISESYRPLAARKLVAAAPGDQNESVGLVSYPSYLRKPVFHGADAQSN